VPQGPRIAEQEDLPASAAAVEHDEDELGDAAAVGPDALLEPADLVVEPFDLSPDLACIQFRQFGPAPFAIGWALRASR